MHFDDVLRKAFDLGTRMAQQGFSEDDNPYHGLNKKLAQKWTEAYALVYLRPNFHKLLEAHP